MIQEPTSRPRVSSPGEENEQTDPRLPVQCRQVCLTPHVLQARCNGASSVSIDEQGTVTVALSGQCTLKLGPEEAFDLLDFLFEHRDFLATRSADRAEL